MDARILVLFVLSESGLDRVSWHSEFTIEREIFYEIKFNKIK